MIHIAAKYIFDGYNFIKNAFISVDDNGYIKYISKSGESLQEKSRMLFYSGILMPGMINSHCHLELSSLKNTNYRQQDLAEFIQSVIKNKKSSISDKDCQYYDKLMYDLGINFVGDIVNTELSISAKKFSKIYYHNFIEISGLYPEYADKKIKYALDLKNKFTKNNLCASIVPHSFYSISKELFDKISKLKNNNLISIHLFESFQEIENFYFSKGNLFKFLKEIYPDYQPFVKNIKEICDKLKEFKNSNIILVHNTFANHDEYCAGKGVFYCLCPNSNLWMHNKLPTKEFVIRNMNKIVIGTDSLASNDKLDLMEEIKTFAYHYNIFDLQLILKLVTSNAAQAFANQNYGILKENLKPGVLLLENADLINLKINRETFIKRII